MSNLTERLDATGNPHPLDNDRDPLNRGVCTRCGDLCRCDALHGIARPAAPRNVAPLGCTSTLHDRLDCARAFCNSEIEEDEWCPGCLYVAEVPR